MSRIGNAPIELPSGVEVTSSGTMLQVKGPKGTLTQEIDPRISVEVDGGVAVLRRTDDERDTRSRHGLYRALLNNMVVGVTEGYVKELTAVGVGYRAALKGTSLELQVGYSHPVSVEAPSGVEFEVPEPTRIVVRGIDKQLVGETAARVRKSRPPEPYKGKGIRYAGEQVTRKVGKRA
jgi:large subunit ribosomal protein L6